MQKLQNVHFIYRMPAFQDNRHKNQVHYIRAAASLNLRACIWCENDTEVMVHSLSFDINGVGHEMYVCKNVWRLKEENNNIATDVDDWRWLGLGRETYHFLIVNTVKSYAVAHPNRSVQCTSTGPVQMCVQIILYNI